MKMSRQNAAEEKCTQPASQIVRGRQKIHLLWRSPLDSPDKKRCPLKSWSKHYEEARVMKKSQIIWHKWGKLKKKEVSRGFVQPRLSQGGLVFWSTSQKFCTAVDTPLPSLFFMLMQMKNCTGSNTITPTRPPARSKMDLCWVTATWSLTTEAEQENPQTTLLNCIVSLMPRKRIEHCPVSSVMFPPSSLCVKYRLTQNGQWGGKWDGQSLSELQLPPSHHCHVMKPSANRSLSQF